jgi:CubicO group peptidase (beta-lactamase class C family)
MVIKNGRIIFQKGYGFANIEQKDSVSAQSNFRLASVTKEFTAMAILQLIEKGKLSLESKLPDVLKDFPAYAADIRIKDLMRHTSGLQDYENLMPADQSEQLHDADVLSLLKKADTLYFNPGEKYKYSNSAYALLSLVIEKISGLPFREYLKQNIFEPAGMTHTLAFENGVNQVPHRAMGYSINDKKQVELSDQSLTSAVLGDGGIYSNLQDMYQWDQVLYTDKLLGRKLLDQAFSHQKLNDGERIDYGFGWHLEQYREQDICYHTGSTKGFRNVIYRIPQQQFSVVILTNRNGFGTLSTMQLARRITDLFLFK